VEDIFQETPISTVRFITHLNKLQDTDSPFTKKLS
jgi:hypothetical protein